MDLQYNTETFSSPEMAWLANTDHLGDTVGITLVIASAVQAFHYPDYYIKRGSIVAQYTGGANDGLWGMYYNDWSDVTNTGLDTPGGVVVDGFEIRLDRSGTAIATYTVGSIIPANVPQQIILGKMPTNVDEDTTTEHTVVVGDLPSGFYDISGY